MEFRERVLLSIQRALLDHVVPRLRAVTCSWHEKRIDIRYLFDGEISEHDRETCQVVGSEVAADFPDGWMVFDEIVRYDMPHRLHDVGLMDWAYRREE